MDLRKTFFGSFKNSEFQNENNISFYQKVNYHFKRINELTSKWEEACRNNDSEKHPSENARPGNIAVLSEFNTNFSKFLNCSNFGAHKQVAIGLVIIRVPILNKEVIIQKIGIVDLNNPFLIVLYSPQKYEMYV